MCRVFFRSSLSLSLLVISVVAAVFVCATDRKRESSSFHLVWKTYLKRIIFNNRHQCENSVPYLRHLHSTITNDEKALGKDAAETES